MSGFALSEPLALGKTNGLDADQTAAAIKATIKMLNLI